MKKEIIKQVYCEYELDLNAFKIMNNNVFLSYLVICKISGFLELLSVILLVTNHISLSAFTTILIICIVLSSIAGIIKGIYRGVYKNATKRK